MKKKAGCLSTLLIAILVFAALSVALEFVLTAKTQSLAAEQIGENLKTQRTPKLEISMHPIIVKYVMGRIDRIYLEAVDFKMSYGLQITKATVELNDVRFDPWQLIKTRRLSAVKSVDSGTAKIVLSEQAVNDLVAQRLPGSAVKLEKGRFRYIGDLSNVFPGATLDVAGEIKVLPDNTVRFAPAAGTIEQLPLPQDVKDYLANALLVEYRIEDIPEDMELTRITVAPGRLTLEADILSLDFLTQGVKGAVN